MLSHLNLSFVKSLSKYCSLHADINNHSFLLITHENFEAAFSLQGGHLIHFQVNQQPPLIYLSKTAVFNDTKAIRGGVPICWPWFGNLAPKTASSTPAHGFARTSKWTLTHIKESDEGVNIELSLVSNEATKAVWNHDFQLTLKASLSTELSLALSTQNTGQTDFYYGGALHTYFNIGHITNLSITGLSKTYSDKLTNKEEVSTGEALSINQPVDAIYNEQTEVIIVDDRQNDRQINILNKGNDSIVVWNPWITGAKNFIDMQDNDYQNMLCIESAITKNKGILVKPEATHTLEMTIK